MNARGLVFRYPSFLVTSLIRPLGPHEALKGLIQGVQREKSGKTSEGALKCLFEGALKALSGPASDFEQQISCVFSLPMFDSLFFPMDLCGNQQLFTTLAGGLRDLLRAL